MKDKVTNDRPHELKVETIEEDGEDEIENNQNIEKMERKHEKETKIRDERIRTAEIDSKTQEKKHRRPGKAH